MTLASHFLGEVLSGPHTRVWPKILLVWAETTFTVFLKLWYNLDLYQERGRGK